MEFNELILGFLSLMLTGGGIKMLIDLFSNKKRKNKLQEIDEKQNKRINIIEEKLNEVLEYQKKDMKKALFANRLRAFIADFIRKEAINNIEFKVLLTKGVDASILVFSEMIDMGLNELDVRHLETIIKGKFKDLRNGISIEKMGVGNNFKDYTKNKIMLPEMKNFIQNFNIYQKTLQNGELYKKFETLAFEMVENITRQTANYYAKF